MCVVSMVGDYYTQDFYKRGISVPASPIPTFPDPNQLKDFSIQIDGLPPTRAEFEALKLEVEKMKELLLRAKKYDEENNEPHCEMEDKVILLKKIAGALGVDLADVFEHKNDSPDIT